MGPDPKCEYESAWERMYGPWAGGAPPGPPAAEPDEDVTPDAVVEG